MALAVIDPATGEKTGEFEETTDEEIGAALESADRAFRG